MSYFLRRKRKAVLSSPTDFYRQRQKHHAQKQLQASPMKASSLSLSEIIDHENLLNIFHELKATAGQAPGPDGITYRDLSNSEAAQIARELSKSLKDHSYKPGPARKLQIPKSSGSGYRTLRIRNIWDRIIATSVQRAATPLWEEIFDSRSYGYRKNKNIQQMLAAMNAIVVKYKCLVIAQEDIKDAFDNVHIDNVLKHHRANIQSDEVNKLITTLLQGDQEDKSIGIDQGCPYSPTALNVALHYEIDSKLEEYPFWFRYADNLVFLCRNKAEGRKVMDRSGDLTGAAGFALKSDGASLVDLGTGESSNVLGFQLSGSEAGLRVSLADESWKALQSSLQSAHEENNPPVAAVQAANGWIEAYGPAFGKQYVEHVVSGVIDLAKRYGFSEVVNASLIHELCLRSYRAWERERDNALDCLMVDQNIEDQMASPNPSFFPADCGLQRAEACSMEQATLNQ